MTPRAAVALLGTDDATHCDTWPKPLAKGR